MVSHLPRVDVDSDTAARVMNGAMMPGIVESGWVGAGPWRVHGPHGELLGVYEGSGRTSESGERLVKPSVVLDFGTTPVVGG
jgi:hypothetical protein